MENKFIISEVATMYDISRPTLIYYDNINLLKPSNFEDNGYRLYTFRDMEKLELILTLKESGLSLKKIAEFMKQPSLQSSIDIFNQQQVEINKKINSLQQLSIILDKRLALISEFIKLEIYDDIRLYFHESMTICKVNLDHTNRTAYNNAIKTLKENLDKFPLSYGSIPSKYGMYINYDSIMNHDYQTYEYVFDYLSHTIDEVELTTLPSSNYVKAMHHGSLNNVDTTIERIINFIDINSYTLTSGCYLIPLVDAWSTTSENDYFTEILIEVQKNC